MLLFRCYFWVVKWSGMYGMMEIVDRVDSINAILVDNNVFVAVDNIDRSRKRKINLFYK